MPGPRDKEAIRQGMGGGKSLWSGCSRPLWFQASEQHVLLTLGCRDCLTRKTRQRDVQEVSGSLPSPSTAHGPGSRAETGTG